jgi:hypothetical protein
MLGRLLFDMTGQLQWYAHRDQASGIQRVTEHLIDSSAIRSLSRVEFVFRPLGSRIFYRLDPSIAFSWSATGRTWKILRRPESILLQSEDYCA